MSCSHSVGEQSERKPEVKRTTTAKQNVYPFEIILILNIMSPNIKMATVDGGQIANMPCHARVETLLTVGYSKLGKKY